MKKKIRAVLVLLAAVLSIGVFSAVSTYAEEKTEDEKHLESLNAYLEALIESGASQEDIDFANKCIDVLKAKIEEGAKAAPAPAAAAAVQPEAVAPYIFVGDSRTVEMSNVVNTTYGQTGIVFIAQNAQGYKWFVEEAIPRIDAIAGKGSKIVINLGVNDPGNATKYIQTVNAKAIEWRAKGAKVYYETVNPVWENPYVTEDAVKVFNGRIANELLGVNIIDTHTFLEGNGYRLRDGLHYDAPTTLSIYQYVLSKLK